MKSRFSVGLALLALLAPALAVAQSQPKHATDATRAEIEHVRAGMGNGVDRQVKIADIGGDNVGVGILRRTSASDSDGEHRGLVHVHVTEVYHILEGGGTLLTGGDLYDKTEVRDLGVVVGPSFDASTRNGVVRELGPGDVVVIPAGVVHAWLNVPNEVVYLSIRIDPDQVLPAGYVHPDLANH